MTQRKGEQHGDDGPGNHDGYSEHTGREERGAYGERRGHEGAGTEAREGTGHSAPDNRNHRNNLGEESSRSGHPDRGSTGPPAVPSQRRGHGRHRRGSPEGTHGDGHQSGTATAQAGPEVALRGPAELADALPYLLGYQPDDSLVVVALQGERAQFGGRIRIGIPAAAAEWPALAAQVAVCVEGLGGPHGGKPEGAVVYLCRDPAPGIGAESVVEDLRPLAQTLRTACGKRDIPVFEALCLSGDRVWSYCCPRPSTCKNEGLRITTPGTSAMAAAATYAGFQLRGTQKDMERRLAALGPPLAAPQERALDSSGAELVPRMLAPGQDTQVRHETLVLAATLMDRFRGAAPDPADTAGQADAHDDRLLGHAEAATMILGLQDRSTRDQAAEWMEGLDVGPALRLWRALARRCVGPYSEHAAAPLTLAGWVAWSGGDEPTARVALVRALRTDPEYVFAQLLHRACNDGLDPELLRRCMREERAARRSARKTDTRPGQPGAAP